MRPEEKSQTLLSITRSKAKMYEFNIPEEFHIQIEKDPNRLFPLVIGNLGDIAFDICEKIDSDKIIEERNQLRFSSYFFDAYIQSKTNQDYDNYLLLLGAASFYLCDLPGSAVVIIKKINSFPLNFDSLGLENLLYYILNDNYELFIPLKNSFIQQDIVNIKKWYKTYKTSGIDEDKLSSIIKTLRKKVYQFGSSRQLLLTDIISAILIEKYHNSSWYSLPYYTNIELNEWTGYIKKKESIKEFWPAQKLLGEYDLYKGVSAIVQMPTSAGKTKAIEIILRTAFISRKINYAVVIAPFRALCNEIRRDLESTFYDEDIVIDEISDVILWDYDFIETQKTILIVTPEKLIYLLRQKPEIEMLIDIIIYDEGHQFDNGIRGVTYELLLTTLKSLLSKEIQQILISAVIKNSKEISKWILGHEQVISSKTDLVPTLRTIAFTSWEYELGQLMFVNFNALNDLEYFVPRIIEQQKLNLKPRERKQRYYPSRIKSHGFSPSRSIATYLGLKVASKGAVAIFCARKNSVIKLCEELMEAIDRGFSSILPIEFSDKLEVTKMINLIKFNLGKNSIFYKCAQFGIFTHHNNIPHSLRITLEYAIKENLLKYVICTSTLAQGVNIPIKYLIIESVYQDSNMIKVRDFHNLLGRVGRAGIHTEGSVIFADPEIFDLKKIRFDNWKWKNAISLLNPDETEPCDSSILDLFNPIKSDDGKHDLKLNVVKLVEYYYNDMVNVIIERIETQKKIQSSFTKKNIWPQLSYKINILNSIESYLMINWPDDNNLLFSEKLAQETLAFFLSDVKKKNELIQIFTKITEHINNKITDKAKIKVYGKTLFGVNISNEINDWIYKNINNFQNINNEIELIELIWVIVVKNIKNNICQSINDEDILFKAVLKWINGDSYFEIFDFIKLINIEDIVNLCDNGFSYESQLFTGAIIEQIKYIDNNLYEKLSDIFSKLQKMLKYGLHDNISISLYEFGLSDRVLCQEIKNIFNITSNNYDLKKLISDNVENVNEVINKYPSYYKKILDYKLKTN